MTQLEKLSVPESSSVVCNSSDCWCQLHFLDSVSCTFSFLSRCLSWPSTSGLSYFRSLPLVCSLLALVNRRCTKCLSTMMMALEKRFSINPKSYLMIKRRRLRFGGTVSFSTIWQFHSSAPPTYCTTMDTNKWFQLLNKMLNNTSKITSPKD